MEQVMKKRLIALSFIFLMISSQSVFSQVSQDSWNFSFGFSFPRYHGTDLRPLDSNYGGFLTFQRNFSENIGLRLGGYYFNIFGRVPGGIYTYSTGGLLSSGAEEISNTLIGADLDLIYYFAPCSPVSPYALFGAGGVHFDPDWSGIINPSAKAKVTGQLNMGLGVEIGLDADWKLKAEGSYHSIDGEVDGIINNNRQGIFGSNADGYMSFNFGFTVYFSKGKPSAFCQLYNGLSVEMPDLGNLATKDDIEEIVKKYIPKEVIKEVVVEKPVATGQTRENRWILVGVNFDLGSSKLRPESYPVLFHAVQVLLMNSDLKVEIQGHTDNIGSEKMNYNLSEERARVVKNYLIARGVEASRLKSVGYGESDPIADNKTANGRSMNRRIEFKVIK